MRMIRLRLLVGRGQVVVGDQHHLVRIPDLRAQALEHRLHAPRPARVVHHRQVDLAGDDLAGRTALPAARETELLGERLAHPCSRNSFKRFLRRLHEVRAPADLGHAAACAA